MSSPSLYRISRGSSPFDDSGLPALPPTARKGHRAPQEGKALSALTMALGLDPPASPGLRPDDSVSVVGERDAAAGRRRLQEALMAVEEDLVSTSESLGGLLLRGFGAEPRSRGRVSRATSVYSVASAAADGSGPPRVPSPPPLPSLAQMGLEHADAGYDDYRSPTYSLYAMYGDRKSRAATEAFDFQATS
jgi:hypothetical protein